MTTKLTKVLWKNEDRIGSTNLGPLFLQVETIDAEVERIEFEHWYAETTAKAIADVFRVPYEEA